MEQTAKDINSNAAPAPQRRWLKRLLFFLIFCVVLYALGRYAIRQQPVQQWLSEQVIGQLNKDLKGDISLTYIDVDWPNLQLDSVLVATPVGDTVIFVSQLDLDILSGLQTIMGGEARFERAHIKDAYVHSVRGPGKYQASIDTIFQPIDYFYDPYYRGPRPEKAPFQLSIEEVTLENIHFVGEDIAYGNNQDVFVPRGTLSLKGIDPIDNVWSFKEAEFFDPRIILRSYPASPAKTVEITDTFDFEAYVKPKVRVEVENIKIHNGFVDHINTRAVGRNFGPEEINWNDMRLTRVEGDVDNFITQDNEYWGALNSISFEHEDGFVLNDLSSSETYLTREALLARDLHMLTPESTMTMDSLKFDYSDYSAYDNFENRVNINGTFRNTRMTVDDLQKFRGLFSTTPFFIQNEDAVFYIDGQLYGRINRLRADDLTIRIGDDFSMKGNFSSRNLAVPDQEYLDLELEALHSDVFALQRIIPGLELPPQFDKLGKVDFNGRFSGFFADFVANGNMNSDLGTILMDMKFNSLEGRELASYSGNMSIVNFDLKTWTGDDAFGRGQMYIQVDQGRGLTLEALSASIKSNVEFLEYQDYSYEDVNISGDVGKGLFDGSLAITDPNADFNFDGTIDFRSDVPAFDFIADIRHLDLSQLNLSKESFAVEGNLDIDLLGIDVSEITGQAAISNLKLQGLADQTIVIDSVYLISEAINETEKYFSINSKELDGEITGLFSLDQIVPSVKRHLKRNHPSFTRDIVIKQADSLSTAQSFEYNVHIKDITEIGATFFPKVPAIVDTRVKGYFDDARDSLTMYVADKVLQVGNATFDNVDIAIQSSKDDGYINLFFDSLAVNDENRINALSLKGAILFDTLDLRLHTTQSDDVNVNFELAKLQDDFRLKLLPKDLKILGNEWKVNANNEIIFNNNKLNARDIVMNSEGTDVRIYQSSPLGLKMAMNGFDAGILNDLWNEPNLDFSGKYDLVFGLDNIFNATGLRGEIFMNDMVINEESWGPLDFDFMANDTESPFDFNLNIGEDDSYINAFGIFFPKNVSTKVDSRGKRTEYFDFDLDIEQLPLKTMEYWIGNVFSETEGQLAMYGNLSGTPENLAMRGAAKIRDGSVKVNYLNTYYTFDELNVNIEPNYFNFSNNKIFDALGNEANVGGGIGHTIFKDFYYDFELFSNEMLAFDTQKGDNSIYYGRGIGSVNGSLKGPFPQPEMRVDATSLAGTTVSVPLDDSAEVGSLDYITFVSSDTTATADDEDLADLLRNVRGMNIEINLTLTDDAKTKLIFDERAGDIIESTGNANLKFNVTRTGEFTMDGTYTIAEGEYLFTLFNVVNKPFVVRPGGTIRWTGDPYDARIDVLASYAKLSTPPKPFIEEYLIGQNDLDSEARNSTDVNLDMKLTGELLQPDIAFDIALPNLDGQIDNLVRTKMQAISQDQNELNRQVFGLIVLGGFFPSGEVSSQQASNAVISKTLSELLSNQFSLVISDLLSTAVEDVSFIDDIDFDISFNPQTQNVDITNLNAFRGSEFAFNLNSQLKGGWELDFGANYAATDAQGQEFFAPQWAVQYSLTKDRRLKIRVFNRTDNDNQGLRRKFGVGLTYQRTYNSFSEFFENAKKDVKDADAKAGGG